MFIMAVRPVRLFFLTDQIQRLLTILIDQMDLWLDCSSKVTMEHLPGLFNHLVREDDVDRDIITKGGPLNRY